MNGFDPINFLLLGRMNPFFDQLAGSLGQLPGFFQGEIRIAAHRIAVLFVVQAVFSAPEFGTSGHHFEVKPATRRNVVWLAFGLGSPHSGIAYSHLAALVCNVIGGMMIGSDPSICRAFCVLMGHMISIGWGHIPAIPLITPPGLADVVEQ
jgi:hypothetical protein